MKDFQFSVSDPNASPPTEAKDNDGNAILTPIQPAETITEAMSKLADWCNNKNTAEGLNPYNRPFRIYKAVRK